MNASNSMNPTSDLDRILTEWLDEGPKRAPDRPVRMAVEHAQAHPRRPDPVWFIRTDAMAPRTVQVAFQPLFALLAVGLLIAAVIAVGVGSQRNDGPLPPTGIVSPSPSAPASPSPSTPSETPSPTPPTIQFNEEITVVSDADANVRVTVFELSGVLDGIDAGNAAFTTDPDEDGIDVGVDPADDTVVHLAVGGCVSQDEYLVTVDVVAGTIVAETSPCEGDTLGTTWAIALDFSEPVDAESLELTLRDQGAVGPSDHPASPAP
jgi:hypothetical protein